ncbi:hypothetical protein MtrunA17_Chr4g0007341 [Medicago truncatula]|uniref:DUF674 family protein n=1 Tax=Medicago truncatula TaxID=3880 RepID=A0A396HZX1_MEDTR|nr:hypothetical protein MtrunA17_Chr4g0007341 [Medicago truncatula]
MTSQQEQQEESKTFPLKITVDKQSNKVVFVEATKDFVETLFSFLSLPLGTIVRLLATTDKNDRQQLSKSSPFFENIKNLYQTVQNLNSDEVWNNPLCKQMLLHPRNSCESLCMKLYLNIDDSEPSSKFYVCDSCNKFTTFRNLDCTCGKPPNRQPKNLDSEGQGNHASNGFFDTKSEQMFLVSDDLKILPSSLLNSMQMLLKSGISDSTQLEEVTQNIGKKEILNLLKYTLTSHEPLTNTILQSSSKNNDEPRNQYVNGIVTSNYKRNKMDIKVLQSRSKKKLVSAEADGDFIDFILGFLTIPLGSILKILIPNNFPRCVGNLYKSVKNLNPMSELLHPCIAPHYGCPNQPLNIFPLKFPDHYYYGIHHNDDDDDYNTIEEVISNSHVSIVNRRSVTELDPREGAVGFVKRAAFYVLGDDLEVKPLAANSFLSYLKELSLPLDDLEVAVITVGEEEVRWLLFNY